MRTDMLFRQRYLLESRLLANW